MNSEYFSVPNIENSYWAGFIAADGNIAKKSNSLTLGLSYRDDDHLRKFCSSLGLPEDRVKNNYRILHKGTDKEKKFPYSCLSVCNKQIKDDLLKNFNITPAKTFTYTHPNITDIECIKAFMIGYLDGDGTISYNKCHNSLYISVLGTKEFCEWYSQKSREITGRTFVNVHKHKSVFSFTLNRRFCMEFLEILNVINVPKLSRKWDKIENSRKKFGNYSEWSEEEKNILMDNHSKMTIREIHEKFFVHKTYYSVEKYAQTLGLKKHFEKKWTDEERSTLSSAYGTMTLKEIVAKHFPYRTLSSVKGQIRKINAKSIKSGDSQPD
jgi:hypothetical protein